MRTEFVDLHFCPDCQRSTEHIKFIYLDEGTITCQVCQNTADFFPAEGVLKKTFTVVSVDEKDRLSPHRRLVTAEIRVKSEPDRLGETETTEEDIMVEWPAYGDIHYTAQVDLVGSPISKQMNYRDAQDISKVIKIFIGKEFP